MTTYFWLFVIGGAITGGVQLGIGALFGAVIGYLLGELVGTGAFYLYQSANTRLIVGGAIVGAFIEHWYDNRGNGGAETAEDDQ